jgi:hypothetical protein
MRDTNLVNSLREHADWWENGDMMDPLGGLEKDLLAAADRLENQNSHIAALQQEIEKLRGQVPHWIPVEERLPEERVLVNVLWVNRDPEPYYEKIKGIPFSDTACFYGGRWYWDSPVLLDYLAEYGKDEFDLVDDAVEITHWTPLPELPEAGKC